MPLIIWNILKAIGGVLLACVFLIVVILIIIASCLTAFATGTWKGWTKRRNRGITRK